MIRYAHLNVFIENQQTTFERYNIITLIIITIDLVAIIITIDESDAHRADAIKSRFHYIKFHFVRQIRVDKP